MLHGNLSSCRWWERLAPLLPHGWRAICPDFRGYGRSESAPQGYNAEAMAEDVLALVDELRVEEYVVAGHSMGGAVALLMALQCPPRVLALGLFDPVPASGVKLAESTLAMMQQMRADAPCCEVRSPGSPVLLHTTITSNRSSRMRNNRASRPGAMSPSLSRNSMSLGVWTRSPVPSCA